VEGVAVTGLAITDGGAAGLVTDLAPPPSGTATGLAAGFGVVTVGVGAATALGGAGFASSAFAISTPSANTISATVLAIPQRRCTHIMLGFHTCD
ncbi:MAG: hypothetical protein OEW08_12845, partial [Gammaproteobacteria bacterium]|nr:hypothetical protein [Gammaproteobacteria bacterium]